MAVITITIKIENGEVEVTQNGKQASPRTVAPASKNVQAKRSLPRAFDDQKGGDGGETEN
jgi:hypothetical protein